jgi:hypothetical protein
MAPARPGMIDQISEAIGRMEGKIEGIDRYNHDREHGIRDLSQKVDGVSAQITREVSRMKAEIQVQLDAIDRRVATLELAKQREEGAKGVIVWFLQSPLVGWVAAAALAFAAWWRTK